MNDKHISSILKEVRQQKINKLLDLSHQYARVYIENQSLIPDQEVIEA